MGSVTVTGTSTRFTFSRMKLPGCALRASATGNGRRIGAGGCAGRGSGTGRRRHVHLVERIVLRAEGESGEREKADEESQAMMELASAG